MLLGGSAKRFGGDTPKQMIQVNGKPLFCYALDRLVSSSMIDEIILVVREDLKEQVNQIVAKRSYSKKISYVLGGDSRSESVHHAIDHLTGESTPDDSIILIQDADRPNLTEGLIEQGVVKAEEVGASVVAIPSSDSVFLSLDQESVSSYQPRETVFLAQTPQTFRLSLLKKLTFAGVSTDEASQVNALGAKVAIVEGSPSNYKINVREDLERFLKEGYK